ncbi:MAG: hypothetical protein SWH68_08170 [Thermodesulfobacteriota bacterium]|nr:hypothetical protein [Thermodesulfobacteriota bacterium]
MTDNETDEIISQADIERLLADADTEDGEAGEGASQAASEEAVEEDQAISQDDIDSLLAGTDAAGSQSGDQAGETEKTGDVISQDDIDSLLAAAGETDETEVEPEGDAETAVADADVTAQTAPESDSAEPSAEEKRSNFLSQTEIDDLLAKDEEETPVETGWGEPDDALSDEVDAGEDEEDQWEDDAAEEWSAEDEPAEPDESPPPTETQPRRRAINVRRLLRSRWAWAAAAGIVGGVVIAAAVVLMRSSAPDMAEVPTHRIARQNPEEAAGADHVTPMPVSVQLNGFLVLAPDDNRTITYIEADVSVYLADGMHARTIRDHQPLFRDLVFQEVQRAVNARNWRAETEMNRLKILIGQAIQQSLPEDAVRRVFLTSLRVV